MAACSCATASCSAVDARLRQVELDDPQGRFRFDALDGDVRLLGRRTPSSSELAWSAGALYGLEFGPARLPFDSGDGSLRFARPVTLPMLGGSATFDSLQIRPPAAGQGMDIRFGLALDRLDVGQLAKALGWPAFTGQLSGRIPQAHYADDRLDFDGGLAMQIFGGSVAVSSLAMERPFGVAPTLSADIALDDLDLQSLTGVFGFGEITGTLDGRIGGLRLVDWQAGRVRRRTAHRPQARRAPAHQPARRAGPVQRRRRVVRHQPAVATDRTVR